MDEQERNLSDMIELSFVPSWARKPPEENPYQDQDFSGGRAGDRFGRERRPARQGPDRRRTERDNRRPRSGPRGENETSVRDDRRSDRAAPPARPERYADPSYDQRPPPLPCRLTFLPERTRIGFLAGMLRHNQRAYPLADLAGLFLSQPNHYLIKFEAKPGAPDEPLTPFRRCRHCGAVAFEREVLREHFVVEHLTEFYEEQTEESAPPAGNFVGVGRCRLSGELLAPPNYHTFNERLLELHRSRFAHIPLESYRREIEIVREPEVIEQWKTSCNRRQVWRAREQPEAPALTRAEAEQQLLLTHAEEWTEETIRTITPAAVIAATANERLRGVLRAMWSRESRQPIQLMLALRPALRHMGIYILNAGGGATFATAIRPHPIPPESAIGEIRALLEYLGAHPGIKRHELVAACRPGLPETDSAVVGLAQELQWLIEKGHIIEFFDGALTIPRSTLPELPHRHHHHSSGPAAGKRRHKRKGQRPGPPHAAPPPSADQPPPPPDEAAAPAPAATEARED